jgi:putative tryptophan/tyrosine transport system substrate-binding protein
MPNIGWGPSNPPRARSPWRRPLHLFPKHPNSTVIAAQAGEPNGGLIVMPDSFPLDHAAAITSLAARYRLPAICPYRIFAELGGLISYRRAAGYADRILRGEKPGELPVQFPVKFELVVNLKTAKALGLEVPPTLLARAGEVIE